VGVCVLVEPDASCFTGGHLTYMTLTRYSRHHKSLSMCWNIQRYSRACCVCSAAPWRLAAAVTSAVSTEPVMGVNSCLIIDFKSDLKGDKPQEHSSNDAALTSDQNSWDRR
jgi:hypothetical protein